MKKDIAKTMIAKRNQLTVEQRMHRDQIIHDFVMERTGGHDVIALYAAFNHEVDTYGIMETLFWNQNITLALPRIEGKNMNFYKVTSLQDLQPGVMGILEPKGDILISKESISLMLMPMVAFNRDGYRIGYGGGYYDRYLSDATCLKIGIAFSFQETSDAFQEAHDVQCDAIITDSEVINVKAKED